MERTLQERLDRLKNYGTRYECIMSHPDGRRYLVCYSHNRGRSAMFDFVVSRAAVLVAITGDESIHYAKRAADGATMGEWTIRFSGRTQRDCLIGGELEYCADVQTATASA